MNLDSIKLKMSLENLDFDNSKYDELIRKRDNETQIKFQLIEKPLGISLIEILPITKEVMLQCSAKCLKENYLKGINKNTIEQLHSEITKYMPCTLDEVVNSQLLRCDITENLVFDSSEEMENSIQSLKLGKSNTGFKVDDYTDRRESIIFTGRQTSYKNRQLYYNKNKELNMRRNKEIRGYLNDWDYIGRIMRVEQNVVSFSKMRQAFGQHCVPHWTIRKTDTINNIYLGNALNSKEKPLYKRHLKIMEYACQVSLFDKYDNWEEAVRYKGWEGIYKECNSSLELMLDFMKATTKRAFYYKWKGEIQKYFSNNLVCKNESLDDNLYFKSLSKISHLLAG